MSEGGNFKRAYARERAARLEAEKLLADKTRDLYDNVVVLEKTLEDLKVSQKQLIQSAKMASIGQLAAGVAHEINNPVGFSMSNIQTLNRYLNDIFALDEFVMREAELPESVSALYREKRNQFHIDDLKEDTQELVTETLGGLERVRNIVSSLKQVTHAGGGAKALCNVNGCIEDALKVVANEIKYKMDIISSLHPQLDEIYAEGQNIQQILINLFINASHACEDSGILTVSTQPQTHKGIAGILIKVKDNGKGMTDEVKERIFDPFFTTKDVGEGTGLGLSVSHNLIEKHGGQISVKSKVGVGTCFAIYLPIGQP
ncbi:sensor histidine kinase [Vibrio ostreicida]|uniref:histidine kinase n=1 Tax=Vibrio ostreicida TaxID=526588 RepID=A0ABT8BS67_9VIBR|nr:ATP-binding protein [Vibrio ostreicida]MDN3609945.1 ATP-binding protein [Vibrio ostreicida]NPD10373.1 histidine kinase [Vibrio ostreicida]